MAKSRPRLLEIGVGILIVGSILFFNPFHNEPLWAEWLIGPVLVYLALPIAMVGAAIYFLGSSKSAGAAKPH